MMSSSLPPELNMSSHGCLIQYWNKVNILTHTDTAIEYSNSLHTLSHQGLSANR